MNIICSDGWHTPQRRYHSKKVVSLKKCPNKIIYTTCGKYVSEKICKTKEIRLIEQCPQIKNDDIYVSEISNIPDDVSIFGEGYDYKERKLFISFKEHNVNNVSLSWFRKLPYLNIVIKPFTVIHSLNLYNCDIGQITILPDYDYNNYGSLSLKDNYINTYNNSFIGKIVVDKKTGKKLVSDKRTIIKELNFLQREILVR